MKTLKLNTDNVRLSMEGVNAGTREEEALTALANAVANRFAAVCKEPFTVEIGGFRCGDEDAYMHAEIATIGPNGDDTVVTGSQKIVSHLYAKQYYCVEHKDAPDLNYSGKIEINVYMYHPEPYDRKPSSVNPAIYLLIDTVFQQYYGVAACVFPEWRTRYYDAPLVCELCPE